MRLIVLASGLAIALTIIGCGGKRNAESTAAPPPDVVLPGWAPEDPSPELLRAARVLKPMPAESGPPANLPQEAFRALTAFKQKTDPLCWELFGSLPDEVIERFLASEKVEMRVPGLTQKQRGALEAVLTSFEDLRLQGEEMDLRLVLYRDGAREDLSNVNIGFKVMGDGVVCFFAKVRGHEEEHTYGGFAHI
jgi:hypothetical protein